MGAPMDNAVADERTSPAPSRAARVAGRIFAIWFVVVTALEAVLALRGQLIGPLGIAVISTDVTVMVLLLGIVVVSNLRSTRQQGLPVELRTIIDCSARSILPPRWIDHLTRELLTLTSVPRLLLRARARGQRSEIGYARRGRALRLATGAIALVAAVSVGELGDGGWLTAARIVSVYVAVLTFSADAARSLRPHEVTDTHLHVRRGWGVDVQVALRQVCQVEVVTQSWRQPGPVTEGNSFAVPVAGRTNVRFTASERFDLDDQQVRPSTFALYADDPGALVRSFSNRSEIDDAEGLEP